MTNLATNILHSANSASRITEEQENYIVYEHLLSMVKEVELDPALAEFSNDAQRQLEEFVENYPEIAAEYHFNKTK